MQTVRRARHAMTLLADFDIATEALFAQLGA
jgi:hypothetical protein